MNGSTGDSARRSLVNGSARDFNLETGLLLVLLALGLCLGCIGRPSVLRLPTEGGPEWTAHRSDHFVLYTNASNEDADEVLAAFERTHALMQSAMSVGKQQMKYVTRIIAFESRHELSEFLGPQIAGMYLTKLPMEQQPHPTMIVQADASRFNRSLFAHEFAHRLNDQVFGPLPVWLEEGLAEYHNTIRGTPDKPIVGDVDPLLNFASGHVWSRASSLIAKGRPVTLNRLPSASALMGMDASEFYAGGEQDDVASERRTANYATAAVLVHMLLHSDSSLAKAFVSEYATIKRGDGRRTLSEVAAELPREELDRELRSYLQNLPQWRQQHPDAPPPLSNVTRRPLTVPELAVLWARMEGLPGKAAAKATEKLYVARETHPQDPDLNYQIGRSALKSGNQEHAEQRMRAALAESRLHAPSLLSLAILSLQRFDGPEQERATAELSYLLPKLTQVAQTGTELDVVANIHRVMQQLAQAEHYSDRAVAADPSCVPCLHHRAALAYQGGDYERAAQLEQRAVDRLDEYSSAPLRDECTGALSVYQRLLSRSGPSSYRPRILLPD